MLRMLCIYFVLEGVAKMIFAIYLYKKVRIKIGSMRPPENPRTILRTVTRKIRCNQYQYHYQYQNNI